MSARCFLDTNVLVYAAAANQDEGAKQDRALELIENGDFAVSAQVLQEFYVTVTRKVETPLEPGAAFEWIEQFEIFPCIATDSRIVKLAIETCERFRISYWDGAIVVAAEVAGAEILYSEDLNDGQSYGFVQVVNPFTEKPPTTAGKQTRSG